MDREPLISVCMPTYNDAEFIEEALNSVLRQTYKNLEIIVCDNNSIDNTEKIVAGFKDKRIRYFKNTLMRGCVSNWNKSIKLASSDIVAVFHSDDIYEPNIVENEVSFLNGYPEAGVVFCLDKVINEEGKPLGDGVKLLNSVRNKILLDFYDLFEALLTKSSCFLVAPTFMARKQVFENVGYFDESGEFGNYVGAADDVEMWLRISRKFKIGIVKERLIKRRVSLTQGSIQYESSRISRGNHFTVIDKYLAYENNGKINRNALVQYEFNKILDNLTIANNLIRQKKLKEAREILLQGAKSDILSAVFINSVNFFKACLYFSLLFFVIIALPSVGIFIFNLAKEVYRKF